MKKAISQHNAEKWQEAMVEYITSIKYNEVWELVNLPLERKPLGVNGCLRKSMKWMAHLTNIRSPKNTHGNLE